MSDTLADHKDFMNARGARAIADHITAYWHERGYKNVKAYAVQRPGSKEWDVRSNLVNGKPTKVVRV